MNNSMEKMIELASQKLGISPEKLKNSLKTGNVDDMLVNMKKEDADKLKSVMNNQNAKDKLLNSPEAKKIMKKMQDK